MTVRVKICGLTRAQDAQVAVAAGAWAVGVVLSNDGPRALGLAQAVEVLLEASGDVERVGVFVSPRPADVVAAIERLPLTRVQIHGELHPDVVGAAGVPLIRARAFSSRGELAAIAPRSEELTLLDAGGPRGAGGTGRRVDWAILQESAPAWPFVLAGGLTPDNVAEAVARTRPYAVDVSSGVESSPGIKDHARVRSFIRNAATEGRE